MRIGLLHNTLNSVGGAEKFTVTLIKKLKEFGHEVILATFDKPDWKIISRNAGEEVEPIKSIYLIPKRIPIFGIYQRTLLGNVAKRLFKQCDYTINTHSDHMFCKTHMVYIHGLPDEALSSTKHLPLWKRIYYLPHFAMTKESRIDNRFGEPKLNIENGTTFVSNSKYTSRKFFDRYGIKSSVIYPPVEVEKYQNLLVYGQRENIVITVARASTDKNLLMIPRIIEKTNPDIQFVLITYANTIADKQVLDQLLTEEKKLNGRFRIYSNMNQLAKRNLMAMSKVYLHTSSFEHFGMALVEGIASGLKPVVIGKGGHLEIVEGMSNLIFNDESEASRLIEEGVYGWNHERAESDSAMMNIFNENRFYFQMMKKIESGSN